MEKGKREEAESTECYVDLAGLCSEAMNECQRHKKKSVNAIGTKGTPL